MGNVYKIIAGIGTLIALYLVLSNFTATTTIIKTISDNSIKGIQVLQGRKNYMRSGRAEHV